ncbi:MAG: iron ABC transporter permease [Staphylothermus sp.]|nr:iron ABC transporter permease [Staphylothermus sp.]
MNKDIQRILMLLLFIAVLFFTMYVSLFIGSAEQVNPLVMKYRFTRVVEVVLTGFILGISGSYLQSALRNPLVDHYILGIGSGALSSVYLFILILGISHIVTPFVAIIGGLIALFLTITIAEIIGGSDISYILAGIGINSLFSGLAYLLSFLILVKNPYALYLMAGGFTLASPEYEIPLIVSAVIVLVTYPVLAKPLNALLLGDELVYQIGYDPRRYRLITIIIAGVFSSIVVSYFGLIGFIGLVSPHIARFLLKTSDNRFVIPLSGTISALLLLITDDLARSVLVNIGVGEVPAGSIVAVIGAPFFLLLILSRYRGVLH